MEEFYKNIGDTLKKNYPGTNAWLQELGSVKICRIKAFEEN
jgi:hypothetical protein